MEDTYTHTIKTLKGADEEITLNRLTVRHGLRLQGKSESEVLETLLDMVCPKALDIISVESVEGLAEVIMEKEKDFFAQMAIAAKKAKAKKASKPSTDG